LQLVGELLDLSRIESGQQAMDARPVASAELLAHVADVFSLRVEESGVQLVIWDETPATVAADFDRIEQVLGNVLDNAFRHAPRGSVVAIGTRAARRTRTDSTPRDAVAEFYVSDQGGGIGADELPHVFDRFYRSRDEASGTGSGLGLAIAREIVRAHGGEIRAESGAAGGTTIAFTLPLAVPEAHASATPAGAPGAAPSQQAELEQP
jgi:two-component system phosphate regulon sensor histidine kinase PhoR